MGEEKKEAVMIEQKEVMNELALFAGAGGGILGGHLLGWRTICAVEIEDYPRRVLLARQRDGILPRFPIWDDVTTFDGTFWRGRVDVVSGGFPCQDISCAGKGAGIEGTRSGLWTEFARIISEVQPRFVLVENSPMLVVRGLGRVLGDLSTLGYDARWGIVGAHHAGAPHKRDQIWIFGSNVSDSCQERRSGKECPQVDRRRDNSGGVLPPLQTTRRSQQKNARRFLADSNSTGFQQSDKTMEGKSSKQLNSNGFQSRKKVADPDCRNGSVRKVEECKPSRKHTDSTYTTTLPVSWWTVEPELGRVAHGVANRVDRLAAIGNGQVPAVARLAWKKLTGKKS